MAIGKVSVVAPIVATEGALAAVIAVALGDTIGLTAGLMLIVIAVGVVLASLEPARPEVPAGGIDITADAIEGPATPETEAAASERGRIPTDAETRRAAILSICAALIFGVGLVATGKAAGLVPVAWVAVAARLVGCRRGDPPAHRPAAIHGDPRRAAPRRDRRDGRSPRFDAVGLGLARQHRHHRRPR